MAESSVSFGGETSGTPVRWGDPGQHAACDTVIATLRARAEAAEAAVAKLNAQLRQVAAYVTGAQGHVRAQFILGIIGTEGEIPRQCSRCEGCGKLADTDDREPLTASSSLPLKSSAAVLAGLVKPVPCDACGGTGRIGTEGEQ